MTHKSIREAYRSMHEPESLRRVTDVYWVTLLLIGAMLVLGSVGYGMRQFFVPPHREKSGVTVGTGSEGFDKAELQKVVQELQKRGDEFNALMTR